MTKDEIKNKRLLKTYGITLAEYQQMNKDQVGCCQICGTQQKTRKLNVDHDHRIARSKRQAFIVGGAWTALVPEYPNLRVVQRSSRHSAVEEVYRMLKQFSIRGLLCGRCNRGLQFFSDSPGRLRVAANYLTKFYDKVYKEKVNADNDRNHT